MLEFPESAADLDRRLVVLSVRKARFRFLQGRLADSFLSRKGWKSLGFVRLADYTRERLGIGARALEDDARVALALEHLPDMTAAFLDGTLSWTALRLVVGVASAHDERLWIERATNMDTRTLEKLVRGSPRASSTESAVSDDEDDPAKRWSVRVSRSGRRLWRAARELAERAAGSTLSQARVLELVAAEAASGVDGSAASGLETSQGEVLARLRALVEPAQHNHDSENPPGVSSDAAPPGTVPDAGHLAAGAPELAEFLAAERELASGIGKADAATAADTSGNRHCGAMQALLAGIAEAEGFRWLLPASPVTGAFSRLDAQMAALDAAEPMVVDERLRQIRRAVQRLDGELAELLRLAVNRRVYRELGFASLETYVESRLGICPRTAWSLLSIERATSRSCPLLARAWREGRVSTLAARILLPVAGSRYAAAWIARAQDVTLRRLDAEVAWALDRLDDNPSHELPEPPPIDHDIAGAALANLTTAGLQMRAQGKPPGATGDDGSAARPADTSMVQITFFAPESVIALTEGTMLALRAGSDSRGRTFERMLALAILEWTAAPAHRDPIFERDGWRCAVPACSSRRNLHDHHLVFRSHGGDNDRDNRVTICAAHHLHGLHRGRIRARGVAPHGIVWEMGIRYGAGAGLARLLGDRYLDFRPWGPAADARATSCP